MNKKRLLIIDDTEMTVNVLEMLLEHHGYKIAGIAKNGKVGFEKFKELKPDLVILDIMMPKMNGLECLEKIIAIKPDAKVIVYTALDKKELVKKYIATGASACLAKPFNVKEVVEVIEKVLAGE